MVSTLAEIHQSSTSPKPTSVILIPARSNIFDVVRGGPFSDFALLIPDRKIWTLRKKAQVAQRLAGRIERDKELMREIEQLGDLGGIGPD